VRWQSPGVGVETGGRGAQPSQGRLPGKGAKRRETQKMVPSPLAPLPHAPSFTVHRLRKFSPQAALESTQGQFDGFFSQITYKSYQNRVASVGD